MNKDEGEANRAETLAYRRGDKLEPGAAERSIGVTISGVPNKLVIACANCVGTR